MTYLGQVVIIVVDLTGSVRVRQVSRREVEQREVDALSWLGDEFDGARRHAVGQRAETVRRRGGRRVAVSEDRHSATTTDIAGGSVAVMLRYCAANVAEVGGDCLLPGVQTLVVIR